MKWKRALDESLSKKVVLIAEDEINNFLLVREYLSESSVQDHSCGKRP